jgi:AcrR family transcriptional regulator
VPRYVDHGQRRQLIGAALLRLAARQGLEALSVRHVAAEAGVSAGMVQHYFHTRDQMMAFAMSVARERYEARATAALAGLGADPPPRLLVRTLATALLPLDEASRDDGRVTLAFLAYAAVRPGGSGLREDSRQMIGYLASLLPVPDTQATAAGLLALVEGLGLYLLGGQYTAEQALAALDAQLCRLFSG